MTYTTSFTNVTLKKHKHIYLYREGKIKANVKNFLANGEST